MVNAGDVGDVFEAADVVAVSSSERSTLRVVCDFVLGEELKYELVIETGNGVMQIRVNCVTLTGTTMPVFLVALDVVLLYGKYTSGI